ncbi:hypothetical protein BJ165DRAFT_1520240 [Panaeolus papilionaceus]|nr:hypothetical protein BJ165DRAFT_1520240 [Panaeolus papilionaceus]
MALTLPKTSLLKLPHITAIGEVRAHKLKMRDHVQRVALTLDPTKLVQVKQPAMDVSGITIPTILLPSGRAKLKFMRIKDSEGYINIPYPDGTRGFFYYHKPSNRPRISGQIRFRVTPSDDPASFPRGYDLDTTRTTHPFPYPWNVSILNLVGGQHYTNLVSQLVSEGLVEETLVQSVRRLSSSRNITCGGNFIFTLSDPFDFNYLHNTHISFRAVTESGQGLFKFISPHGNLRNFSRMDFKSGIVKLRFERSTLPEHDRRRVVVARCLEIVEPLVIKSPTRGKDMDPLDVATYIPVPGQLLQTLPVGRPSAQRRPRPWGIDISDDSQHPFAPALRLLW